MNEVPEVGDIETLYEVTRPIADGRQGDLFVGRERGSTRRVAIKVQKPQQFESQTSFENSAEELDTEGDTNHELADVNGVPRILCRGSYLDRRCIVLEFVEGEQLLDAMVAARPIKDVATAASIVAQLCTILDSVHRKGFVHRDVKPENVMLGPGGRIHLLDLGMAIRMNQKTLHGCGTMGFAPPEQLNPNPAGLTGQADIFALGCLLLEITVMQLPYGGTRQGLMHGDSVLPADRLAAIPAPLARIALSMVDRDPERRPADVREVLNHVRPLLPLPGSRPPAKRLRFDPTEPYRRPQQRQ